MRQFGELNTSLCVTSTAGVRPARARGLRVTTDGPVAVHLHYCVWAGVRPEVFTRRGVATVGGLWPVLALHGKAVVFKARAGLGKADSALHPHSPAAVITSCERISYFEKLDLIILICPPSSPLPLLVVPHAALQAVC